MDLPEQSGPGSPHDSWSGGTVSILMRFAQYKLLDMAFRKTQIHQAIFNMCKELQEGKIDCADILRVEEDRVKNTSEIEEMKLNFFKKVKSLQKAIS
jgi:hypothetical protein